MILGYAPFPVSAKEEKDQTKLCDLTLTLPKTQTRQHGGYR